MKRAKRASGESGVSPKKTPNKKPKMNGHGEEKEAAAEKPTNIVISIDQDTLLENIRVENAFIKRAINSIPPHIYFNSETMSAVKEGKHSAMDEKLKEVGLKSGDVSKKSKRKRVKLDPEQHKTVAEIIDGMKDDEEKKAKAKGKRKTSENPSLLNGGGAPASIDALRSRLEAKIAALSGKRHSEEWKERHRLKRRISKLKMKERRKSGKPTGGAATTALPAGGKAANPTKPRAKRVFNEEGKMVFSKFDFTDGGGAGGEGRKKGEYSGKNYKQLLQKVEKEKEQMKALEEKDSEKAGALAEKKKWKAVLDKAEGIKVKNDPEMLKKALQRKAKKKEKSAKDWAKREEAVKEKQEKQQKKRKANIQARKEDKIKHKIKRGVKKGRIVPGF